MFCKNFTSQVSRGTQSTMNQLTKAETKDALDTLAFLSTIACFRYRSIP